MEVITGFDLAEDYRSYKTKAEALRLLKKYGGVVGSAVVSFTAPLFAPKPKQPKFAAPSVTSIANGSRGNKLVRWYHLYLLLLIHSIM